MSRILSWTMASLVFLAACGERPPVEPAQTRPDVWWQGDLVELDGEPVASGIRIRIQSGDQSQGFGERGAFRYKLETGCTGAGLVTAAGAVQAAEVLRACDPADVGRMNRLTRLSHSAVQAAPAAKATLRWDDREAVLSSDAGHARFRTSETR